MEEQIIEYLRDKYKPKAILLAGSRAEDKHGEGSDWDLFLFTEEKFPSGFFEWEGQSLDITFKDWPMSEEAILTIPYKPLYPVKVLFDSTDGALENLLKRTKLAYDQGPLIKYGDACQARLDKLERWLYKLDKHKSNPEIQFYYAGYMYEFILRLWFEQQNKWPLPPAEAVPFIQGNDPSFLKLLSEFVQSSGEPQVRLAESIASVIKDKSKTKIKH